MKNILLILLTLTINTSFAQTEKSESKIATESFIENYNNENYKAIFSSFSSNMQNSLPFEKIREFLSDLKSEAGKIINRKFIKYNNGTSATYKTEFEHAIFTLYISLDNELKINGFFIKPFIVNNLLDTNKNITKEQSGILFDNVKYFPNQTQVSLAIIKKGLVSFYGIKRNNDAISSIENSSNIFEIGSISKVFTSTLLAGFVIDNKLNLNDTIDDYFKFPIKNDTKISFKQLANHTSGLPRLPSNLDSVDPKNPYKDYGAKELVNYLKEKLETKQKPGTKYEYSNLGVGLLGYVLSINTSSSYEEMLQNNIFLKYNMKNSTSIRNNIKNHLVVGLDKDGNETSNYDLSILVGAGGILSNVEDLAKFTMAQFDNTNIELELTRQKTFEVYDSTDVGLGWDILKSKSINEWFWHNGGTGGYKSSMVFDPINKNGVIVLSNVSVRNSSKRNIDILSFALMKTLEK